MSKMISRANHLFSRVLIKESKCFSTVNHRKCINKLARFQKSVCCVQKCKASNLAGPVSNDNVLSSPYGDVEDPKLTLTDFIFENHKNFANLPAITCGMTGRSYTYGACRIMIQKIAKAFLSTLHLKPGETIGLVLPNIPEFPIILNGALEAGLRVTFANPLYTSGEITRQFVDSSVKCIVTIDMLMPQALDIKNNLKDYKGTIRIGEEKGSEKGVSDLKTLLSGNNEAELPKVDPNDVALIPYSSGTTGLPKGVMLTHKNLVINLKQIVHKNFSGPDDIKTVLTVPPFFHIYGFNGILNYNMRIGNNVVTIPRFTPEDYLSCLRKHKPSGLFVVPALLSLLASHPMVTQEDLSSVKDIVVGAAPITDSIVEKFLLKCDKTKDQLRFQQGFGMTESSPVTILTPFSCPSSKVVAVGQLIPGTEARIVSLTKKTNLGPNDSGELYVRGPQIMKGYLNNEAATKETVDSDGWLHTGDVAYYDEDHFFFIVDRTKELIKVKGNQVSPTEIENVIMEMPMIADAAVIGIPDHLAGELPKAFVVVKSNAVVTEKEIIDFVAKKVAKYKRLAGGVSMIKAIPRNPGGKVLRNELKVLGGKSSDESSESL